MFNRANKMTALLVAAAAVVSLVPATGVNAAEVKRISSEDGKVYHAVAYKDGQVYIDGELNDKDEAAYYLANGKYNELEKIDSNSAAKAYGEKYVNIEDGDYFVDLTNGKVTDDNVKEDDADDAGAALRKKIKDDTEDRYDEENAKLTRDDDDLDIISGNKFGDVWYETSVEQSKDCDSNGFTSTTKGEFTIYTDAKGNYIDADHNLGTVKVRIAKTEAADATTSSAVKIENTDKVYKEDGQEIKASIKHVRTLGQDSKNIYRYAKLTITADTEIREINGKDVTPEKTKELSVIQKISKDQASGDIDGAKYAKTVYTYVISNDDTKLEKDAEKFYDLIETEKANVTVVNGKLIAYAMKGENKIIAQTASLKTKSGWYYTDCEGQSDEDVDYNKDDSAYAVDVDVDGNLWRIDGGFVYKFDNTDDWDKLYKVDGSMDRLSVYNKDNMVVWNEDDEVYSVIGAKEDKEEEKPEVEVKAGWNQAADGTWTFVKADGTKATGWYQDGATWYLLNDAGIMQTGWQTVGGTWYYLAGNGAMQTGWQNVNGAWYYLLGNGAMQTGWINDNGTWYFCDGSGKMLANTTVNGYVLGANGAWVK
ncbi:N-acetylmuramoyl-L-alanine amidase family protein [Clostridium botulinum]|nr:N-acetylmuramoyl-L-alanine amidase family protein [Clostridium botulinum]NFT06151.1 N-acetylmuramoyl-L-alanine amidase family protein [Clostridium botulinum]